jgi:hypothetical protein
MPREAVTQTFARRGKSTTDSEWETLQRIGAALGTFEDGIGRDFRENCEKRYQQYRGFQKFRNEWTAAGRATGTA